MSDSKGFRVKGRAFFGEDECLRPCPYPGCADCERYWERMVREGLWVPGEGWTRKALFGAASPVC